MIAITNSRLSPFTTRILLCTEQSAALDELLDLPSQPALEIDVAMTPAAAIERLRQRPFELAVVDANWDAADFDSVVAAMESADVAVPILRLTYAAEESNPVTGLPVEVVQLPSSVALVRKLFRSVVQKSKLHAENRSLKRQLQARILNEIVGQSEAANHLRESIRAAADEDGCVLIQGEPGTGSQQTARLVHLSSRRALRPFLVLDCRVHSAESLERELFGEAGRPESSTEADSGGRLTTCAGGTLLLKNVDLLPVAMQKRLAAILGGKAFVCPLTGKSRPLDVRLMASTHRDLADAAQQGEFNVNLYGQITAQVIHVPALRERAQDVGLLTESVLNRLAFVEGKPVKRLSVEALKVLRSHNWPGNLRELANVVERACSIDEGALLTAEMLRPWIARAVSDELQEANGLSLREMERKLIETTFARCQGNREQTARLLKIGIRTLSGKLREYGYPPRGGPGSNRRFSKAA